VSSLVTLPTSQAIYTALDEWRNGKKRIRNTQRANPAIIREFSWTDWRVPLETFQDIHSPSWNSGISEYKEAKRFRFHAKILLQQNFFLYPVHKLKVQTYLSVNLTDVLIQVW